MSSHFIIDIFVRLFYFLGGLESALMESKLSSNQRSFFLVISLLSLDWFIDNNNCYLFRAVSFLSFDLSLSFSLFPVSCRANQRLIDETLFKYLKNRWPATVSSVTCCILLNFSFLPVGWNDGCYLNRRWRHWKATGRPLEGHWKATWIAFRRLPWRPCHWLSIFFLSCRLVDKISFVNHHGLWRHRATALPCPPPSPHFRHWIFGGRRWRRLAGPSRN